MMRGGSDQEWFGDEGWFAVLDDLPILVQSIFLAVEKTKYLEMGKLKEQNFMLKRVIFHKKPCVSILPLERHMDLCE